MWTRSLRRDIVGVIAEPTTVTLRFGGMLVLRILHPLRPAVPPRSITRVLSRWAAASGRGAFFIRTHRSLFAFFEQGVCTVEHAQAKPACLRDELVGLLLQVELTFRWRGLLAARTLACSALGLALTRSLRLTRRCVLLIRAIIPFMSWLALWPTLAFWLTLRSG